jgi:hypothetical protein
MENSMNLPQKIKNRADGVAQVWSSCLASALKIELLCDPAIPFLGTCQRNKTTISRAYQHSHLHWYITHNSQIWKQQKYPLTDE